MPQVIYGYHCFTAIERLLGKLMYLLHVSPKGTRAVNNMKLPCSAEKSTLKPEEGIVFYVS
jgi:hypothetical protein